MPIEMCHIFKSYDQNPVLVDFNLVLEDRAITCLMGPSGCGKTTAAHILLGLVQPDRGEIKGLEGRVMSAVFQESRLPGWLDAVQNIRLVTQNKIPTNEIVGMLETLGLSGSLQKPVSKLSGGMRRRVAIARALLYPSDFIVMDEPFKGLDEERKTQVMEIISDASKQRGMLFITHDEEEAEFLQAKIVRMAIQK